MMDCFRCKGSTESKLKTYAIALDKCVINIKNAPSFVCKQCGEIYFTDDVIQNLESIVDRPESENKEAVFTEYAKNAT